MFKSISDITQINNLQLLQDCKNLRVDFISISYLFIYDDHSLNPVDLKKLFQNYFFETRNYLNQSAILLTVDQINPEEEAILQSLNKIKILISTKPIVLFSINIFLEDDQMIKIETSETECRIIAISNWDTNVSKSIFYFKICSAKNKTKIEYLIDISKLYLHEKDLVISEDFLNQAKKIDINVPIVHFQSALLNMAKSDFSSALYDINKCINLEENNFDAIFIRANIHQLTDDLESACKDWLFCSNNGHIPSKYRYEAYCRIIGD